MPLLLLLLACDRAPDAPAPVAAAPTPVADNTPIPTECLPKLDLADGAEDHVVHRCANCALVMEGDAAHPSQVAGYTFHSCSETCQHALDAAPGAVIARACAHP